MSAGSLFTAHSLGLLREQAGSFGPSYPAVASLFSETSSPS